MSFWEEQRRVVVLGRGDVMWEVGTGRCDVGGRREGGYPPPRTVAYFCSANLVVLNVP